MINENTVENFSQTSPCLVNCSLSHLLSQSEISWLIHAWMGEFKVQLGVRILALDSCMNPLDSRQFWLGSILRHIVGWILSVLLWAKHHHCISGFCPHTGSILSPVWFMHECFIWCFTYKYIDPGGGLCQEASRKMLHTDCGRSFLYHTVISDLFFAFSISIMQLRNRGRVTVRETKSATSSYSYATKFVLIKTVFWLRGLMSNKNKWW